MEVKRVVKIGDDEYGIRKLSWKSLQKAEKAHTSEQVGQMREMGGDLLRALRGEAVEAAAEKIAGAQKTPEGQAKARYGEYDMEQILVAGLQTRNGSELSHEEKMELDKPTADILHRAIVDLSDPLPEVVEAEQGKS